MSDYIHLGASPIAVIGKGVLGVVDSVVGLDTAKARADYAESVARYEEAAKRKAEAVLGVEEVELAGKYTDTLFSKWKEGRFAATAGAIALGAAGLVTLYLSTK
jgi:hypothetical protein